MSRSALIGLMVLFALPLNAAGEVGLEAVSVSTGPDGEQTYSITLQILAVMTAITVLPAGLIMMTAFTRIIVVLAILRQALGTAQTPSSQVLIGLALFLTFFVMTPVFERVNDVALQPYINEELGLKEALSAGAEPSRSFMLAHTRESDLAVFAEISGTPPVESQDEIGFSLLLPAFVTSELKTAFQIGFLIFSVFDYRSGSGERVDVHGHDDVVTAHYLVPFQDHAVCTDRWLGVDHGHAGLELLSVKAEARVS